MIEEIREASAIVVEDPFAGMKPGDTISFLPSLIPVPTEASTLSLNSFDGIVGIVSFYGNGVSQHLGCCVVIGPGIAVSARHVFGDWMERISRGEGRSFVNTINAAGTLHMWQIERITSNEGCDLALLMISPRTSLQHGEAFRYASITSAVPRTDDVVSILGYTSQKKEDHVQEHGTKGEFEIKGIVASVGEVYHAFRDRAMLRWPSFELKGFSADSGMSGGPIFTESGKLIGVVCSSVEGQEDGPTYGSLLFPMFHWNIDPSWPPGMHKGGNRLVDLPTDCITVDRTDCFVSETEYRVWEDIPSPTTPSPVTP